MSTREQRHLEVVAYHEAALRLVPLESLTLIQDWTELERPAA